MWCCVDPLRRFWIWCLWLCFSAAFSCLTCSKGPNNIPAVDVVCGPLSAAILLHLPSSPAVLPQGTALATLLGMGLEASVSLKCSFWFPGQLCVVWQQERAGVPLCIPNPSSASSRVCPGAGVLLEHYSMFEALWLEVVFQFLQCSAKCVHLCYQGHVYLSSACWEEGSVILLSNQS